MKSSYRRGRAGLRAPLLRAAAACQRPEEPVPPADLLPKAQLIPLLADLHVLEARVENSRLSPDSSRALYVSEEKNLLWSHQVTDSVFRRSYRYYGIHGKDLDEVYGAVIDTLTQREAKLGPAAGTLAPSAPAPIPAPAPVR